MKLLRSPLSVTFMILVAIYVVACASASIVRSPKRVWSPMELYVLEHAKSHGMVSVQEAVPGIWVDQRYRTERNITGAPFYPAELPCLLHQDTAAKLAKAQKLLNGRGYQLKIWDAYRPAESHMVLWNKFGMTGYVHEPGFEGRWSWHCYGRAVDATLLDSAGRELQMPTDFDDFSSNAWAAYKGSNKDVRDRLRILQWAMQKAGFEFLNSEWWHFADPVEGPVGVPMMAKDLGLTVPAQ